MAKHRAEIEIFNGHGRTLTAALNDAARAAITKDRANVGKEYVVLAHVVTVSNPRISEHKVVLGAAT